MNYSLTDLFLLREKQAEPKQPEAPRVYGDTYLIQLTEKLNFCKRSPDSPECQ
ncbi:MAG: hypothetical protein HUJ30_09565 [Gammaproteobacteria bacterium]|nr:hypothetical protein [Gammaproteobacteria bacterium]